MTDKATRPVKLPFQAKLTKVLVLSQDFKHRELSKQCEKPLTVWKGLLYKVARTTSRGRCIDVNAIASRPPIRRQFEES